MRIPHRVETVAFGLALTATALTGCDNINDRPDLQLETIPVRPRTQEPPKVIYGLSVPGLEDGRPSGFNCDIVVPSQENIPEYPLCAGVALNAVASSQIVAAHCIMGAAGTPELISNEVRMDGEQSSNEVLSREQMLARAVLDPNAIEPLTGLPCVASHASTPEAANLFKDMGFTLVLEPDWQ